MELICWAAVKHIDLVVRFLFPLLPREALVQSLVVCDQSAEEATGEMSTSVDDGLQEDANPSDMLAFEVIAVVADRFHQPSMLSGGITKNKLKGKNGVKSAVSRGFCTFLLIP